MAYKKGKEGIKFIKTTWRIISIVRKVTAALMMKDNLILIAKRKPDAELANVWEFPGGKIEAGETPEECLRREMKEEFNIDVTVDDFFANSIYHYEHGSIELLAYWTHWKDGVITLIDHSEVKWVTIDELDNYDFAPADIPFVKKLKEEIK